MSRPTLVQVDLAAVEHNLQIARTCAPASQVVACIKADAYGHGAPEVAQRLDPHTDLFGVASLDEALALDALQLKSNFLLMEGCFCEQEQREALARGFDLVLHNRQQLAWIGSADPAQTTSRLWLKLETGMHRLGFPPAQVSGLLDQLGDSWKERAVLMSHFASAEETAPQPTLDQLARFDSAAAGFDRPRSLANSAAILAWPQSHQQFVRPGFMLYGNSPFTGEAPAQRNLRPAMRFSSQVIALHQLQPGEGVGYNLRWRAQRPSRIAVVAAGYGDGYPRTARDGTPVLVKGQRALLAGTVSMDMLAVDVTDLPVVELGDEVELWGPDLAATEVAAFNEMSAYELFTRLPVRPRRLHLT